MIGFDAQIVLLSDDNSRERSARYGTVLGVQSCEYSGPNGTGNGVFRMFGPGQKILLSVCLLMSFVCVSCERYNVVGSYYCTGSLPKYRLLAIVPVPRYFSIG